MYSAPQNGHGLCHPQDLRQDHTQVCGCTLGPLTQPLAAPGSQACPRSYNISCETWSETAAVHSSSFQCNCWYARRPVPGHGLALLVRGLVRCPAGQLWVEVAFLLATAAQEGGWMRQNPKLSPAFTQP